MTPLAALIAAAVLASPQSTADGASEPPPPAVALPAWFEADAVAAPPPSSRAVDWLLIDTQVHVGATTETVHRWVRRVNTPEGVESGAELRVSYDPGWERFRLHRLRVLRDGRAIDARPSADYRLVSSEDRLEQRLLDGSKTALLVLHDVRPGDTLDLIWSLEGSPAWLAGHYGESFGTASRESVARLRVRLLWPSSRKLHFRAFGGAPAPVTRDRGAEREYLWDAGPVAGVHPETGLPEWYPAAPYVQLSDFASWAEVARWVAPLFAVGEPPPSLAELARPWKDLPEEERAQAALRFVREQVRYFGMEMGANAFQPHAPAQVLERRFGDCKDKALLLATLLRTLGIDARIALVNTAVAHALDDRLPSAFAFNHAIVRARIAGDERYLDATWTSQRGAIPLLSLPYERALVIEPTTTALARIPQPALDQPTVTVEETWHARDEIGTARLSVVSTYRGSAANQERSWLASKTPDELAETYLKYYRHHDPEIAVAAPPVVADDVERDSIRVEESYRLAGFWTGRERQVRADSEITLPNPGDLAHRTLPFAMVHPRRVLQHTRIELPEGAWNIPDETRTVKGPAFSCQIRRRLVVEPAGPVMLYDADFSTSADSVPAAQARDYQKAVDELHSELDRTLTLPDRTRAASLSPGVPPWAGLGLVASVLGLIFLVHLGGEKASARISRYRQQRFRRRTLPGPGESASTPLVADAAGLERHLRGMFCDCGERRSAGEREPGRTAMLAGRPIESLRLRCACGAVALVYFERAS